MYIGKIAKSANKTLEILSDPENFQTTDQVEIYLDPEEAIN